MILALTTAVPVSASAQVAITGAGTASCGDLAKLYRLSPETAEFVFLGWAQGFLSGMNMAAITRALDENPESTPDDMLIAGAFDLRPEGMEDEDAWFNYLRRFCDQRPLATFLDAVVGLSDEILARQDAEELRRMIKETADRLKEERSEVDR